jgi:hypothetical protein
MNMESGYDCQIVGKLYEGTFHWNITGNCIVYQKVFPNDIRWKKCITYAHSKTPPSASMSLSLSLLGKEIVGEFREKQVHADS